MCSALVKSSGATARGRHAEARCAGVCPVLSVLSYNSAHTLSLQAAQLALLLPPPPPNFAATSSACCSLEGRMRLGGSASPRSSLRRSYTKRNPKVFVTSLLGVKQMGGRRAVGKAETRGGAGRNAGQLSTPSQAAALQALTSASSPAASPMPPPARAPRPAGSTRGKEAGGEACGERLLPSRASSPDREHEHQHAPAASCPPHPRRALPGVSCEGQACRTHALKRIRSPTLTGRLNVI